jgi:hypothetical protein
MFQNRKTRDTYAAMRAKGHSHGRAIRGIADRWLNVLVAMLRQHTLYDPLKAVAAPAGGRVPPQ